MCGELDDTTCPCLTPSSYKQACSPGRYSDRASSSTDLCLECPTGRYNGLNGQAKCETCPIGTTTWAKGQVSKMGCRCLHGWYITNIYDLLDASASAEVLSLEAKSCARCPKTMTANGFKAAATCVGGFFPPYAATGNGIFPDYHDRCRITGEQLPNFAISRRVLEP